MTRPVRLSGPGRTGSQRMCPRAESAASARRTADILIPTYSEISSLEGQHEARSRAKYSRARTTTRAARLRDRSEPIAWGTGPKGWTGGGGFSGGGATPLGALTLTGGSDRLSLDTGEPSLSGFRCGTAAPADGLPLEALGGCSPGASSFLGGHPITTERTNARVSKIKLTLRRE